MVEEKKKSWFRRHWILTTICVLILLLIIIGASNSNVPTNSSESSATQTSESQSSSSSSVADVWSKTSGYTLEDCLKVCEKYCVQAQTDVCQGTCQMIGKEGSSMDKTVNNLKNITAKLKC